MLFPAIGAAGCVDSRALQVLEHQDDRQESLIPGLQVFRDHLNRVVDLNLDPNLNDGGLLDMASLQESVRWAEPKKCWQEPVDGKYDWSRVGQQLGEKGIVH